MSKRYCENYEGDNLSCVMCIEHAIFTVKPCYQKGGKNELRKMRKEN